MKKINTKREDSSIINDETFERSIPKYLMNLTYDDLKDPSKFIDTVCNSIETYAELWMFTDSLDRKCKLFSLINKLSEVSINCKDNMKFNQMRFDLGQLIKTGKKWKQEYFPELSKMYKTDVCGWLINKRERIKKNNIKHFTRQ